MRRGEVWTVAGGADYAGKQRPAVIVQDDDFAGGASVTLCPLTSDRTVLPLFRLVVDPNATNGLRSASSIMVDKITTIPRTKVGDRIGRLSPDDMHRLNRAIAIFLGVAG